MVQEFKKFISQGNVLDLAVGLIIGVAFGKIVSSFVGDLLMPLLGILLGGIDFTSLGIVIKEATEGKEPVIFAYGKFIQAVIDFLIIAFEAGSSPTMINARPGVMPRSDFNRSVDAFTSSLILPEIFFPSIIFSWFI